MTEHPPSKDLLIAKAEQLELYERKKWYFNPQEYSWLAAQLRQLVCLQIALRGVQSCSTCEACRGAATLALGGTAAEPPAVPVAVLREHWLTGVECDHAAKTDVATCYCSRWRSAPQPNIPAAVNEWIQHLLEQPASPQPPEGPMNTVFVCSNEYCRVVWNADPQGHCPACKKADGGGWSTISSEIRSLPKPASRELIDYGYAPGSYSGQCLDCLHWMDFVDKRCRVCKTCAEKRRDRATQPPEGGQ